jgi:hypothetical protein
LIRRESIAKKPWAGRCPALAEGFVVILGPGMVQKTMTGPKAEDYLISLTK